MDMREREERGYLVFDCGSFYIHRASCLIVSTSIYIHHNDRVAVDL